MRTRRCLLTVALACLFPALRLDAAPEFSGPIGLSGEPCAPAMSVPAASKEFPSLSSHLTRLYLSWQKDPGPTLAEARGSPELRVADDGSVLAWVLQAPGELTTTVDIGALERLGGRVAGVSDHFLEAWIPIVALPRVADEVPGVTFLRPPVQWEPA